MSKLTMYRGAICLGFVLLYVKELSAIFNLNTANHIGLAARFHSLRGLTTLEILPFIEKRNQELEVARPAEGSRPDMILEQVEYSASESREIIQSLFPHRRLVLSQFTFFNQVGIARPSGSTFKRGRRCYRLLDLLSIACILALKEEGIPFKNIESVPQMVQSNSKQIFEMGPGCRLLGHGKLVGLVLPGREDLGDDVMSSYLSSPEEKMIFWSFDLGLLAAQLRAVAESGLVQKTETQAA